MNPAAPHEARLAVSIPRTALALDACRHQQHLSEHGFAWRLQERLKDRLGYLVIAGINDVDCFELAPVAPRRQTIDHAILTAIDTAIDDLLSAPEQWRRCLSWTPVWEEPDPWNPWRQEGRATWGTISIRFTIAVKRESFALMVGYRAEGDKTRKWYRCQFPAAYPSAEAIGPAIERSVGIWLSARWPEGPCDDPPLAAG